MATCEWFALCVNPTEHGVSHPVLGLVPCCDRCATKLGMQDRLVLLAGGSGDDSEPSMGSDIITHADMVRDLTTEERARYEDMVASGTPRGLALEHADHDHDDTGCAV